jgi:hypothetical protein
MAYNMGYCKFQNTLGALQECLDNDGMENEEKLSKEEQRARMQLIKTCVEIAEDYGEVHENCPYEESGL